MRPTNRLTYANVASTLALVVALGGGGAAVAAGLAKNSVGSKQIKAGAVKTTDLGAGAVDSSKVRDGSLTGADVAESTLGQVPSAAMADVAATATTAGNVLWATVDSDGSLVAAQSTAGATSAPTEDGTGTYEVVFTRDVSTCSSVGSITAPGAGVPDSGMVSTTGRGLNPNGIYITTRNKDGDPALRPFALVVVC